AHSGPPPLMVPVVSVPEEVWAPPLPLDASSPLLPQPLLAHATPDATPAAMAAPSTRELADRCVVPMVPTIVLPAASAARSCARGAHGGPLEIIGYLGGDWRLVRPSGAWPWSRERPASACSPRAPCMERADPRIPGQLGICTQQPVRQ